MILNRMQPPEDLMRNAFAAARCGIELLAEDEQQDLRDLPPR